MRVAMFWGMGASARPRPAVAALVIGAALVAGALPAAALGASRAAEPAASGAASAGAVLGSGLTSTPAGSPTVTLVGAGDIASCGSAKDSATAALVSTILSSDPNAIAFTAGDNVYPYGSAANYANCYRPTWGSFKNRTRAVPGNHDYRKDPGGAAYFAYFGAAAGPAGKGYYAYDAGAWRIYALNSECGSPCFSAEYAWLQSDLAANPHQCTLAIWHEPRFSTGPNGNSRRMAAFFRLLYSSGTEIVINGHDHMYERYVPLDPNGVADPANGVREFVVGTGGASLHGFKTSSPLIAVRDNTSHGVLWLDLSAGSYTWHYIPIAGNTFTDSGSGTCH